MNIKLIDSLPTIIESKDLTYPNLLILAHLLTKLFEHYLEVKVRFKVSLIITLQVIAQQVRLQYSLFLDHDLLE